MIPRSAEEEDDLLTEDDFVERPDPMLALWRNSSIVCSCWDTVRSSWMTRACIPVAADPKAPGEPCVRLGNAQGEDDCAAGAYCSYFGGVWLNAELNAPQFQRVCSSYCRFEKDCPLGEACVVIGAALSQTTGLCRPRCELLGPCGAGEKCGLTSLTTGSQSSVCMPAGPAVADGKCDSAVECGQGLGCVYSQSAGASLCRVECDPAHVCADGFECSLPFGGGGGAALDHPGFGYCLVP